MPIYVNQETGEEVEFSEHPNDLRSMLEEANREKKELLKWRAKHEPIVQKHQEDERFASVKSTFTEKGLTDKAARMFQRLNPGAELSEDTIKSFAEEFVPEEYPQFYAAQPTETKPAATSVATGFVFEPTTQGGPATPARIDVKDYIELRKTDPARAFALRDAGLVNGY